MTEITLKQGTGAPNSDDLVAGEVAIDNFALTLYSKDAIPGVGFVERVGINDFLALDGGNAMKADIDLDAKYTVTNVKEPSADSDVATKLYVDELIGGGAGSGNPVVISDQAPADAEVGDLWFCSLQGEEGLFCYNSEDPQGEDGYWFEVAGAKGEDGINGIDGAEYDDTQVLLDISTLQGETTALVAVDVDLQNQIDTLEDSIVDGGGFVDAPDDAKLYGRKSEEWEEIVIPDTDLTGYATETYVDDSIAAIDFPDGAGMLISDTEPADPVEGTQWLNSDTAEVYIWDGAAWLEFPAGSGGSGLEPTVDLTGYATEVYVDDAVSAVPAAPVDSVNGKTGAVVLSAADVGALPNDYVPPGGSGGGLWTDNGDGSIGYTGNVRVTGDLLAAKADADFDALAIGTDAGKTNQGYYTVAIGYQAGKTSQGEESVAVGYDAAGISQGTLATAIGTGAGYNTQGQYATAVGNLAGKANQGEKAVAVGHNSGQTTQGLNAVAVGYNSGVTNQGDNSIAIGNAAGATDQGANGIIINSSGVSRNRTVAGHIYITSGQGSLDYNGADAWTFDGGVVNGLSGFRQNGAPVIDAKGLISTLSTLRNATKDETTVKGLRDAISDAIGGLIEKFENEIATMPAGDES